jgi:hypothetical protein
VHSVSQVLKLSYDGCLSLLLYITVPLHSRYVVFLLEVFTVFLFFSSFVGLKSMNVSIDYLSMSELVLRL